ncbi:MAG TPA: hypothetical protein DCR95_09265 [Desulfobacter sp.]|nr:hypothetical protein [Desulfobacter sp.]
MSTAKHTIHPNPITVPDIMSKQPQIAKKSYKFDLAEAIKLRIQNKLSFGELAKYYGVPKQTIHSRFKVFLRIVDDPELNDAYSESRAQILNGTERVLVSYLTDSQKLKDASLNNVAYAFQQVTTARRLEEGLSTQNISNNIRNLTEERKGELGKIIEAMYQARVQASNGTARVEEAVIE